MKVKTIKKIRPKYKMVEDGTEEYCEFEYIANDGRIFNNEYDCVKHEEKILIKKAREKVDYAERTFQQQIKKKKIQVEFLGKCFDFYNFKHKKDFEAVLLSYGVIANSELVYSPEKLDDILNDFDTSEYYGFITYSDGWGEFIKLSEIESKIKRIKGK